MNEKVLNFEALKKNLDYYSSKKVCAMVKANAYGHGVKEVVEHLKDRVEYFGVCSYLEAVEVRKFCDTKVLIVSPFVDILKCKEHNFEFVVDSLSALKEAMDLGCLHLVHIKIDVGMNRFGFSYLDKQTLKKLKVMLKSTQIAGICTHFAELGNSKKTKNQYKCFCKVKKFLGVKALTHLGGSEVIDYNFDYNMIRVGIGLYTKIKQIMEIKSKIIELHDLQSGEVGYEGRFEVKKPSKIALIPVGYADGLPRVGSGANVEINGRKCKIIGNICMDLCFVDVTGVDCKIGDGVSVVPNFFELAKKCKTSIYEVLTNFNRLRDR